LDEVRLGSRTLQPRRQLLVGTRREPLGKRALDILSVLAEAKGEIVTKDELLEAVWPGIVVEENALQVHVVALRKALGPEADRLRTIRGVGYQLDVEAGPAAPAATAPTSKAETVPPIADAAPPHNRARPPEWKPAVRAFPAPQRVGRNAWSFVRSHWLWSSLLIALVLLAGAWLLFGAQLGLRSSERIPILVQALTPSGTTNQTEAALANGLTEELILRLRRVPDLRVATAEPDGSAPSAAFANGYVVGGTISSSGDRLRVAVRLTDANGEILWSDALDRRLSDLFDMQDEIASAIAGALSVSFDVGADSTRYGGTDNPEAYAAYMQYWQHALDFDQSVPLRYLERAAALDPDFGKAIGGLTLVYGNQLVAATSREEAGRLLEEIDKVSARALSANDDLWFGHAIRAWYFHSKHDFASAEREMRRVAELDPGDSPELRAHLATYALHTGRLAKSISIRDSRDLIDPIYQSDGWKIFDRMMTGRYDEAISMYDRLSRSKDRNLQAFVFHAYFAYLLAGREHEAEQFVERAGYDFAAILGELNANRASPDMVPRELREWAEDGQSQLTINLNAVLAAHHGHEQLAVDLMRLAYERPGGFVMFFLWHPAMAEARKTDAFEQLVTDIGLVRVWRESGDWGDFCKPLAGNEISCR
jgi:DNA-binding winged helix-turn-helix (wHTH) protein/TolB-like protein